jgi:hypothetical protein
MSPMAWKTTAFMEDAPGKDCEPNRERCTAFQAPPDEEFEFSSVDQSCCVDILTLPLVGFPTFGEHCTEMV